MRTGAFAAFPEDRRTDRAPLTRGLGEVPVGLGQSFISNLPTTVPPASILQTANAVFGDVIVQPCHQVSMVVFPIPNGSTVWSDPKTVLEDLGFTVTGVGDAPSGGKLVYATLNSATPYQSNPADAMLLVYSGEGRGPFQSGEAVTQGSTWGGVVSWVNDDPSSNTGSLGLSYAGGPGALDPTSSIIGFTSNAYASPFAYGAVLVSPKGNGKLGVTNFTDLGAAATSSGPCQQHNCPAGTFWNGSACTHLIAIKACPAGYSFSAAQFLKTGNGCVPPPTLPGHTYFPGGGYVPHLPIGGGSNAGAAGPTGPTGGPPIKATPPPAAAAPSTGMSTGAMVAIGVVALGAIGGLAWLMEKRKHAALAGPMPPHAQPAPAPAPVAEEPVANPWVCRGCGWVDPNEGLAETYAAPLSRRLRKKPVYRAPSRRARSPRF